MKLTARERKIVFDKCNGRCAYCGEILTDRFQVDHVISKQYWWMIDTQNHNAVNAISNLMPACAECNHYKRSHCLEDSGSHIGFRTFMKNFHIRLSKLPKSTVRPQTERRINYLNTIAVKYGITKDKPFSGKFYFESIEIPEIRHAEAV